MFQISWEVDTWKIIYVKRLLRQKIHDEVEKKWDIGQPWRTPLDACSRVSEPASLHLTIVRSGHVSQAYRIDLIVAG